MILTVLSMAFVFFNDTATTEIYTLALHDALPIYVDFRNEDRAPLLFIAGGEDNIMPPAVNQSNAKHYRHAKSPTDYREFEGRSHYGVIGGEGWEEVADYALEWAVEHASARPAA